MMVKFISHSVVIHKGFHVSYQLGKNIILNLKEMVLFYFFRLNIAGVTPSKILRGDRCILYSDAYK